MNPDKRPRFEEDDTHCHCIDCGKLYRPRKIYGFCEKCGGFIESCDGRCRVLSVRRWARESGILWELYEGEKSFDHPRLSDIPEPLHLVLEGKWYDAIDTGPKRIEYRDNTPYWRGKLLKFLQKGGKEIVFHRGYTRITMIWKVKDIVCTETQFEIYLEGRVL